MKVVVLKPAQLVRVVVGALGQAVMAVLLVPVGVEKGRKVNAYGQSLQSLVVRRVKDHSPGPGQRDCWSIRLPTWASVTCLVRRSAAAAAVAAAAASVVTRGRSGAS